MSDIHILDTIELPGDMRWTDRYWTPFEQTEARTITGNLIIEPMAKTGGRPVTLDGLPSGDWKGAWITAASLATLYGKLTAGYEMQLLMSSGESMTVTWRVPGIEVQEVDEQYPPIPTARYCVRLNLQEVA